MDRHEIWDEYLSQNLVEAYDKVYEFFSGEIPEGILEDYEIEDLIMETEKELEQEKEFDKLLEFRNLLKNEHPQLYEPHYQYFDEFALRYYCYHDEPEKIESIFSNFMAKPIECYETCIYGFRKLLYYQYREILNKTVSENYELLVNSDEYTDELEDDMGLFKYYYNMEDMYQRSKEEGDFDKEKLGNKVEQYDFKFEDKLFSIMKKALFNPIPGKEKLIKKFNKDRQIFIFTLEMYLLKYMKKFGINFESSGMIWRALIAFCLNYSDDREETPEEFFNLDYHAFDQYLGILDEDIFTNNISDLVAIIWGGVYVYDFLKSIDLIGEEAYQNSINTLKASKDKILIHYKADLWETSFITQWKKPECVSEKEFEGEKEVFKESYSTIKAKSSEIPQEIRDELAQGFLEAEKEMDESESSDDSLEELMEDFEVPADIASKPTTVEKEEEPGRNDPCPCGSGKKYKHCCWRKNH